jgi:hypothetical protein
MLSPAHLSVDGMTETFAQDVMTPYAGPALAAAGGEGRGLFGQIVSVYQSNEFLFAELKTVREKLNCARAYLDAPGSNPVLAEARLLQLRARHSAVLTLLRANRLQARGLLARAGAAPSPS